MVSLWPWKGNTDNSPAYFEKTLAALAQKISKLHAQQDALRQRSRRYRALWTLYTTFAYLLCLIIAVLVVGWKNLSMVEYTILGSAPVAIYLIRTGITKYYTHRIATVTARLKHEIKTRNETIAKLKIATKYDSTQSLLDKYGGSDGGDSGEAGDMAKKQQGRGKQGRTGPTAGGGKRTGIPPPPTANIVQAHPQRMGSPQDQTRDTNDPSTQSRSASIVSIGSPLSPSAEFAPNAFPSPLSTSNAVFSPAARPSNIHHPSGDPHYTSSSASATGMAMPTHWYDRILDLLLGEDETSARNRLALICQRCRLVNGLAAPGMKTLEAVGSWRCSACGAWNGKMIVSGDRGGGGGSAAHHGGEKGSENEDEEAEAREVEAEETANTPTKRQHQVKMSSKPSPEERNLFVHNEHSGREISEQQGQEDDEEDDDEAQEAAEKTEAPAEEDAAVTPKSEPSLHDTRSTRRRTPRSSKKE